MKYSRNSRSMDEAINYAMIVVIKAYWYSELIFGEEEL